MSQFDDLSPIPFEASSHSNVQGFGARLLNRLLEGIRFGRLRIVLPSGAVIEKCGREQGPEAKIVIRRWRMLRRVLVG
ncbi:MAG: SAM-dependent methyltransferase, partial [Rhizobiaceae bacterium]|nr:SAM-dependent methyltransferase [Rhizobiaceae bacterium]